ncbi:MAG: insulinase family protein, partial [Clostridia bacterium]|nr:insulinase family protein [Clostridia bacterium]
MSHQTFLLPTGEAVDRIEHPSGLTIFVYPKRGFRSTYAMFATRYGSIDTSFVKDGERIDVPAGIAHYLEHKLFENEDCDAFERYAETGASANAYTSFDQTAYLFSCTQQVTESLEILLDFVQKPYFTEQTVEKERGIIGQEIRMGEDSPFRRVFCNLLKGLYSEHPVQTDIAGTVESIAQITPELLYDCYDTFYNTIEDGKPLPYFTESISRFGIPFSASKSSVAVWDARQAKYYPDEVVLDYLSRGLILDGDAAKALCERGFGKYLGVSVGEDVLSEDPMLVYDLGAREV